MEFPCLPRFGLRLFLNPALTQAAYYGMGPDESYVDKHRASWHGIFKGNIRTMHKPYLRPQEYGAHWDCGWCSLAGGGRFIQAAPVRHLCFRYARIRRRNLKRRGMILSWRKRTVPFSVWITVRAGSVQELRS